MNPPNNPYAPPSQEQADCQQEPCCALATVKLLAMSAHAGQFRRDGITPYINHPEAVAKRVRGDDEAEMVAWLHDVIEDTNLRESEMLFRGVPRDVIEAVVILTKGSRVNYDDYLARVKAHPVARKVKIADMLTNLADTPTEAQIVKYARGLLFLLNARALAQPGQENSTEGNK